MCVSAWIGRDAFYGTAWMESYDTKDRTTLPLSRKALAGWLKDCPGQSKAPPPEEGVALMDDYMIANNGYKGTLAAAADQLAVDSYLRPTETISMKKKQATPPSTQHDAWVLTIAPQWGVDAKPAKNQTFDSSVKVGGTPARKEQVDRILKVLYQRAPTEESYLFDGLDLKDWEKLHRDAARGVGVAALQVSPQAIRHVGPSHDHLNQVFTLPDIQMRGRWLSLSSVRRYAKPAALLRQAAKMTKAKRAAGAFSLKSIGSRIASSLRKFPLP